MKSPFEAAINQICEEKHLDRDVVIHAIESAIAAAYRKEYGNENQKLICEFDERTGAARVFNMLDVVEEVEFEESQISLKHASKILKNAQPGDKIKLDITPKGSDSLRYGRIAAQTAKQVIIQRLQEAERDAIFSRYKGREGELINARVHRVEDNNFVFVSIDGATVLLEPREQIPGEKYYVGQRVKLYIAKVEKTTKGPAIIVSRAHPKLIYKLLELEVPEIQEGTVGIKSIAREAGIRAKVAVMSLQEGVDPVGSCVGQRGVRIQAVTNEIGDEKIDIIEYKDDMVQMIINALSPAKITSIELLEDERRARVYVLEDQRSLAIGKNGQNVRLASKLLGWEIDILDFIVGETDMRTLEEEAHASAAVIEMSEGDESFDKPLESLKSLNKKTLTALQQAGYSFVSDIAGMTLTDLAEVPGLGVKTAEKLFAELTE